jgi:hypothetical protein
MICDKKNKYFYELESDKILKNKLHTSRDETKN